MSTSTPYQEEEGSSFESNGVRYDLNQILRETAHLPVLSIKVNRLKWIVDKHQSVDEARVQGADLQAPLLVTVQEGREVTVDGYHRLLKALRQGVPRLPYRRVAPEVMDRARLQPGERHARPQHTHW